MHTGASSERGKGVAKQTRETMFNNRVGEHFENLQEITRINQIVQVYSNNILLEHRIFGSIPSLKLFNKRSMEGLVEFTPEG